MVGVADGSRNTPTCRVAVCTIGSTQAAAARGEAGDVGRKPKTSSRESVENDSANGPHTLCFHCGDSGHAASFSDEASVLELCWLGSRHPYELGIRNDGRPCGAPTKACCHSRLEPQLQPAFERGVHFSGNRWKSARAV